MATTTPLGESVTVNNDTETKPAVKIDDVSGSMLTLGRRDGT